jgi:S1-C subfamily serine protease
MDRILAAHGTLVAGRRLVRLLAGDRDRQGREHPLEVAFHAAAERAWPVVVSLDVQRRRPVSARVPLDEGAAVLPRHQGPVTGFLLSRDGEIVTSLYGLTNVGSLVEPLWRAPEGAGVEEGLGDVVAVTAHLAGGHAVPARILGHDARLGVVLLRADLPPALAPRLPNTLVPAPASAFERGRFVLALGNPYGAARPADPLLAAGILSKHHPEDVAAAWRGQWQTDAPGLDTNAGGPAVDLEGRLLGMLTLWHPAKHGRNSGIAFLVPLERIRAALPALRAGAGPRPGLLGVRFAAGIRPVVEDVEPGSGAGRAGLRKGDVVLRIDREAVVTVADAVAAVRFRYSGETVRVTVERGGQEVALLAELGER